MRDFSLWVIALTLVLVCCVLDLGKNFQFYQNETAYFHALFFWQSTVKVFDIDQSVTF